MRVTIWIATIVAISGTTGLWAADSDFAAGAGAGPAAGNARADPAGNELHPAVGLSLLFSAGVDLLRRKRVALGVEIPVAVHGSRSADILARGSYAGIYTERLTAVLTPGIRVRLAPREKRVSPWLSFGAGVAMVRRTGDDYQFSEHVAAQIGSSRTLALAPAGGADIPVARRLFVRVELRTYLYRTPATGFVSSFEYWNRWNHNVVVAGGLGFRIR